ncbi:hypothetical protein ACIOK4_45055 [Streptomyces bottropensis]|uniref:hypothetical protein n=1 Tax=Streptomyces bottropensis TaxID=42235 RepID=UPI003791B109
MKAGARRPLTLWQGIRKHKGWNGAGVIALGLYGVVAAWQHDDNFGRILAAYGGIFVAWSIAWGTVAAGYPQVLLISAFLEGRKVSA